MPPNTNSKVSFAKTTLPYPIFAAEFDPYNRGYLVVGGGGGEGRSGVPNQISVLDVSSRSAIENVLNIELSSDEDSAVSLSSLATKDGLVVFAGVNSSEKEQNAGTNEHLRSFEVRYPPRKKQKTDSTSQSGKGGYKFLGKRSLFTPSTGPKSETYQRILRLSPAQKRESPNKRIGAVATGLAKESEIVIFNATSPTPEPIDTLARIQLPGGAEANDLDIAEPETSEFSLVYCTDYDLYEQTFKYNFSRKKTEKVPNGPRRVWQMPEAGESSKTKARSKIRCLRFLNAQNVILLCNKPGQTGAELRIVHLYPTGPGMEMARKDLPKHIKQAATMDVCALDEDKHGNQQIVVAVAGQDISIEVYTTDYQRHTDTFSPLQKYITMKDVHEHQMTKLCFTPFHRPGLLPPSSKRSAPSASLGTQFIGLASTSYGNTVVVDTFPVTPLSLQDRNSRYILRSDDAWVKWALGFIAALIIVVIAFLIQAFRGGFSTANGAGLFSFLPQHMRDFLDEPASAAYQHHRSMTMVTPSQDSAPTQIPSKSRLRDLLHLHGTPAPAGDDAMPDRQHAIVIRAEPAASDSLDDDVHVAAHPDKSEYLTKDPRAKHWHELQDHERVRWRERLVRAGEWVEGEGEKILMGVLFSEYAGMVGEVVQEVVREL